MPYANFAVTQWSAFGIAQQGKIYLNANFSVGPTSVGLVAAQRGIYNVGASNNLLFPDNETDTSWDVTARTADSYDEALARYCHHRLSLPPRQMNSDTCLPYCHRLKQRSTRR